MSVDFSVTRRALQLGGADTTTGGALPIQTAPADATHIFVMATLNKTYEWYAKVTFPYPQKREG